MLSKFLNILIITSFLSSLVTPISKARADNFLDLPEPGVMVNLSIAYEPVLIKGLKVHPENPFLFDFIIDSGNSNLTSSDQELRIESRKLIKYFLAAMTVPEKDLWVNLSPYEKNKMIASNLAQTEMGRDMLAQDYILKQLTASLIYPERDLGKTFWDEVYSKAEKLYGTTQVPVNTFNKVWIVADKADVYEHDNTAYVVGAHLKVMLEEDYLSLEKHLKGKSSVNDVASVGANIVRKIILPQIEQEVNRGKNFSSLRQMFYSMILASWYKTSLKNAILTQIYGNQSKVKVGVNQANPQVNQEIFNRYLRAYKKGVFNYIKEDVDRVSQQPVPRKYFSGGTNFAMLAEEGGVLHRYDTLPSGDYLSETGSLFDENIALDPAQAVGNSQDAAMIATGKEAKEAFLKNFPESPNLRTIDGEEEFDWRLEGLFGSTLRRAIDLFKKGKAGEGRETTQEAALREYAEEFVNRGIIKFLPESWIQNWAGIIKNMKTIIRISGNGSAMVRYSDILDMPLTKNENKYFISEIENNEDPKLIAFTEKFIKEVLEGGGSIVLTQKLLDERKAIFHPSLIGKTVNINSNVVELFPKTDSDDPFALGSGYIPKYAFAEVSWLPPSQATENVQKGKPFVGVPEHVTQVAFDAMIRRKLMALNFIDHKGKFLKDFYGYENDREGFINVLGDDLNKYARGQVYDILKEFQIKNNPNMQVKFGVFFRTLLRKNKQNFYLMELGQENVQVLEEGENGKVVSRMELRDVAKSPGGAYQFKDRAMAASKRGAWVPYGYMNTNELTESIQAAGKSVTIEALIQAMTERQRQKALEERYFESSLITIFRLSYGYNHELFALAKKYLFEGAVISLVTKDQIVEINNPVLLLGLDIAFGARVQVRVFGVDKRKAEEIIQEITDILQDHAMSTETVSAPVKDPGGIDFNSNHMRMNVHKERNGVQMRFDPAMILRIKAQGFDGLEFRIQSILPILNLPILLGLETSRSNLQVLN